MRIDGKHHRTIWVAEDGWTVMILDQTRLPHEIEVAAGDVALLPAGTGHFRRSASRDFLVVGAYPPGQVADLLRSAATPRVLAAIASVPIPATDPVHGRPLTEFWGGQAAT